MLISYRKILLEYKLGHFLGWAALVVFIFTIHFDTSLAVWIQIIWAIALTTISMPPLFLGAYWLVPRFLYKKRIVLFIVNIIVLVIGFAFIGLLIMKVVGYLMVGKTTFDAKVPLLPLLNVIFWDNLIGLAIGIALKIISDRFRMERHLREVEKEKVETELNFLRSQMNPHFLFNVMNTIYFQINKENINARTSVETFSEMLRYQLYECTSDKVDIAKEIAYIKNYFAIQTLRLEPGTNIQLNIEDGMTGFNIAPLLILPIVENAFKHISHHKDAKENTIDISLCKKDDKFIMQVYNTYDRTTQVKDVVYSGGLGIQNLKRRLELLYPGKYEFNITRQRDVFTTFLSIQYK